MADTNKSPQDLTKDELVELVEGLREMMYGDADDEGNPTWNPDMEVVGADLVDWVCEEMSRRGLVPEAGPRE